MNRLAGAAGVVLVAAVLLSASAHASNIGFRYSLGLLTTGPTAGLYWIAIPYIYTPPDLYGTASWMPKTSCRTFNQRTSQGRAPSLIAPSCACGVGTKCRRL